MSNNNRDYDRNQKNETEEVKEREPYEIVVTPANFEERAIGLTDNMKSSELLEIVNGIFRSAFEDYEGSKFIVDGSTNNCYIELYFHHRLQENEDTITAFSQSGEMKKYSNKTVQRIMNQDRLYREGNSYHITTDGKDAIAKFIMPNCKNRKGQINWDYICADVAQPVNNMATNAREVLSRISYISPNEILKAQFGTKNYRGANVQYQITSGTSIPSVTGNPEWMLSIVQINETQLDRALRKIGFTNPNGLGIVK